VIPPNPGPRRGPCGRAIRVDQPGSAHPRRHGRCWPSSCSTPMPGHGSERRGHVTFRSGVASVWTPARTRLTTTITRVRPGCWLYARQGRMWWLSVASWTAGLSSGRGRHAHQLPLGDSSRFTVAVPATGPRLCIRDGNRAVRRVFLELRGLSGQPSVRAPFVVCRSGSAGQAVGWQSVGTTRAPVRSACP